MAQQVHSQKGDNKQAYVTSLDIPFLQIFNAITIDIITMHIMILMMLLTNQQPYKV